MAVAPTGAIYKALKFDNVSSRTYGVYITGEAVYNAPERDVEMITIPGRSGSFALDNGRFENITVTYPAGIFAETEADFRDAISEFRNFLCSRKGYVRLQDEYNPNEYRMAVYKSGLEVEPAMLKAGEFEITFDCKPQRWLTSGETKQTIANSGDTITNPTLFESGPLLEVEGYGTVGFNGYEIELENAVMGDVLLADKKTSRLPTFYNDFSLASLNAGDTITVNGISVIFSIFRSGVTISSVSDSNSDFSTTYKVNGNYYDFTTTLLGSFTGQKGTYAGKTNTVTISGTNSNGAFTINVNCTLKLDNYYQQPNDGFCSIEYAYTDIVGHEYPTFNSSTCGTIRGNSTMSLLGNPTYVDCDLGECYLINGGDVVSLNAYIDLGSKLPTLAPGSNTITYDNTITDLKVTPRWWKV